MQRLAILPALIAMLAGFAVPVRAQFDEPDSIPRFSIGATAELVFRGTRGTEAATGIDVSFGGGPPLGLRAEYRLGRTLGLGAAGSWARLEERQETASSRAVSQEGFTQWQFTGELMLKVKPSIPGFFILGGGARYIIPDERTPTDTRKHNVDENFTDPLGIVGAGVELGSRSSRVFKLDFRLYLVAPADQVQFETKSVALDFGVDFEAFLRI